METKNACRVCGRQAETPFRGNTCSAECARALLLTAALADLTRAVERSR